MKSFARVNVGLIVAVGAALLMPAALATAGPGGPQPRMELPQVQQDAGTFEEGTVVPFRFEVANRGDADLIISQAKPSCGCTDVKWDRVIKPGAEGTITADVNTLYFRGAVTKHVTVFSNDPNRPEVDLSLTAHLRPLVQISPDIMAVLSVNDQPVSQEFTLERSGGKPMKVVNVIAYAPYLKAATTPLPGPGHYKLTITATPDAPLGSSKAAVVVWTDLPQGGAQTFFITVNHGIATVPPMVFLGILPQELKAPQQGSVTILRGATPFHVKQVSVSDPHLTAKLETVRAGAEYRVTVTYTGGWESGRQQQTLTVTTDDPKQPEIAIPVQAIIQAGPHPLSPSPNHWGRGN